jgi:hypothetical protein
MVFLIARIVIALIMLAAVAGGILLLRRLNRQVAFRMKVLSLQARLGLLPERI